MDTFLIGLAVLSFAIVSGATLTKPSGTRKPNIDKAMKISKISIKEVRNK